MKEMEAIGVVVAVVMAEGEDGGEFEAASVIIKPSAVGGELEVVSMIETQ